MKYIKYIWKSLRFSTGEKVDAIFAGISFVVVMEFFNHMTNFSGVEKFALISVSFILIQVIWLTVRYALKK